MTERRTPTPADLAEIARQRRKQQHPQDGSGNSPGEPAGTEPARHEAAEPSRDA